MSRKPIFVDAKGDVSSFESIEAAERALEPIDVENNEYKVFDRDGLLLRATVTPDQLRVRLSDSSPPDRQPDELTAVLRRFLSSLGTGLTGFPDDELWRAPLPALVERMQALESRARPRRRSWWPWGREKTDPGHG
jgi:hypothetical protein